MNNPFKFIEARLRNIENLILDLKHQPKQAELAQHLADYKDIKERIEALEKEVKMKFKDIHQALNYLLQKDKLETEQSQRKRIGFKTNEDDL